jgi:hypothetical protein
MRNPIINGIPEKTIVSPLIGDFPGTNAIIQGKRENDYA